MHPHPVSRPMCKVPHKGSGLAVGFRPPCPAWHSSGDPHAQAAIDLAELLPHRGGLPLQLLQLLLQLLAVVLRLIPRILFCSFSFLVYYLY